MPLLQEQDKAKIKELFTSLVNPVKLVTFTQTFECDYCQETRQIVEEVAALSDKISAEIYNFALDKSQAEQYNVDKIPAIAIVSDVDYGIRFYGIPSGYEFASLIEDIIDVSRGESGLSQNTIQALSKIQTPVHIQVFVTPTCPYCPRSVRLAHKLALQSEHIRADAVEAMEFPHLAIKYHVQGVPRTVINETTHIEGAVPEAALVQKLVAAVEEG